MTGLCEDELDGKAYDLGVSAFLRKPFEPEHLLVALDQLVGNSNGKKQ
jgi:CheY-like chemotaxis protein